LSTLSFSDARAAVLRHVRAGVGIEDVSLRHADGRVLAEDIRADRDYPPFNRSARDGFAVRSGDLPGRLRVIGEVRAGAISHQTVGAGEALEIMTGAPVPAGADAVVMVEHCIVTAGREAADGREAVEIGVSPAPGANITSMGSEASTGEAVLTRGTRIDFSGVSWLATTGRAQVRVFARPRVAIIATGDEIVEVTETPAPHQIRNSNAWSLAAQVARAGGVPVALPIARDDRDQTRRLIEEGLKADLLLISGGVSAGRYDVVEPALADLGAEIFFDRVLIQPGQPLVFGRAQEKFFFGLPGNPASTMVTFELFARAAIELLGGAADAPLHITPARLTRPFHHKAGLTRFLPAVVRGSDVTPVAWQGSGDVPALCAANAFMVAEADTTEYGEGQLIGVMLK
jgi:molybdopterin molybdotransferase